MSDNKLDKLITDYGMAVADLLRDAPPENVDKARQAIVDYVEKEKKELRLLCNRYNKLIMAVANKYPDESRHDTALRYIREAEGKEGIGTKQNE